MKHLRFAALLGAVTLLGTTVGAQAQLVESPTQTNDSKLRTLKIANVSSAYVAYWLDPAHNARPGFFGSTESNQGGNLFDPNAKGAFVLPGEVRQVISVDPQNVILVAGGSDADFEQLKKIVDGLDKPIPQVELETQTFRMSPQDARQFGLDFSNWPGEMKNSETAKESEISPTFGFMKGDYRARLNALVAAGKATFSTPENTTVFNNFNATISFGSSRVFDVTSKEGKKRGQNLIFLHSDLNITPTISGDDTVSLQMKVTKASQDVMGIPSKTLIVADLRDGDTILLRNAVPLSGKSKVAINSQTLDTFSKTPLTDSLFRSKLRSPQETLVLLTARVPRKADKIKAQN